MNGKAEELAASHIIVAPGGMERPVPFPGWTLPGVMGAGGADILLRSGGTLSADKNAPVVLAGNGPLLLLLAGHLLEAGVPIAAWLDTGWWSRRIMAGALMPAGVLDMPYVAKGMKMALRVLKGKVPIIRNVTDIRAVESDHLEKVVYDTPAAQDPRNQRLHPAAPRGHHPAHAHPQFPERQARMGRRPAVLASRRRRKRPYQRGRHFHRR